MTNWGIYIYKFAASNFSADLFLLKNFIYTYCCDMKFISSINIFFLLYFDRKYKLYMYNVYLIATFSILLTF